MKPKSNPTKTKRVRKPKPLVGLTFESDKLVRVFDWPMNLDAVEIMIEWLTQAAAYLRQQEARK